MKLTLAAGVSSAVLAALTVAAAYSSMRALREVHALSIAMWLHTCSFSAALVAVVVRHSSLETGQMQQALMAAQAVKVLGDPQLIACWPPGCQSWHADDAFGPFARVLADVCAFL